MALFPSPLERTVAAALLLLSNTKPRSPSPISHSFGSDGESVSLKENIATNNCSVEENLSLFSASSKSKSSSITSDGSSKDNRARKKLRFVKSVARSREMKFKVARKRRSKVYWSTSDDRKVTLALPAMKASTSESTEASCISSTATAASCARSHSLARGMQIDRSENREKLKRNKSSSGSAHLRHQAEAILKMLSRGSSSEVRIRQQLGDSPDTSKALRMLLKKEAIKRSGMGGRFDPYIYKIA